MKGQGEENDWFTGIIPNHKNRRIKQFNRREEQIYEKQEQVCKKCEYGEKVTGSRRSDELPVAWEEQSDGIRKRIRGSSSYREKDTV